MIIGLEIGLTLGMEAARAARAVVLSGDRLWGEEYDDYILRVVLPCWWRPGQRRRRLLVRSLN